MLWGNSCKEERGRVLRTKLYSEQLCARWLSLPSSFINYSPPVLISALPSLPSRDCEKVIAPVFPGCSLRILLHVAAVIRVLLKFVIASGSPFETTQMHFSRRHCTRFNFNPSPQRPRGTEVSEFCTRGVVPSQGAHVNFQHLWTRGISTKVQNCHVAVVPQWISD